MKKLAIFLLIIIAIVSTVAYVYLNNVAAYNNAQRENIKFEVYKDQEIYGAELSTLINRATDTNLKNKVQKDENGKYIENETNSINIDIKFIDDDVTYNMEKIYNGGMNMFLAYYSEIRFKCNEIQYHENTNRVKYMLFEQVTQ